MDIVSSKNRHHKKAEKIFVIEAELDLIVPHDFW